MNLMNAIGRKNILTAGDVMLDQYDMGSVSRISPEAPVPVFRKKAERHVPGGAANVAANLAAAQQQVFVMAAAGKDPAGGVLRRQLQAQGIDCSMLAEDDRATTVKTRFLAEHNQQIMRLDIEDTADISDLIKEQLLEALEKIAQKLDLIVISDYRKGFLTRDLMRKLMQTAARQGIKVLADVKDPDLKKYEGAYLLKPNLKELQMLADRNVRTDAEIAEASRILIGETGCTYVLTTCGAAGMVLTSAQDQYKVQSMGREVFDVTGAGDTAIAYLAACLANGMEIKDAVLAADCAAGIQVGKAGTSRVTLEEVHDALSAQGHDGPGGAGSFGFSEKILTKAGISRFRQLKKHKKIVFTNGCFDLLHTGHIRYLQEASRLGDLLVVGLNSDASVRRLKGEKRPVNSEADRAAMLCALECVDYAAVFSEDTPKELIAALQPDVLVKGGDYTLQEVAGKEIVQARGGIVKILPFYEGKSTTGTIERILSREAGTEKKSGEDE